MKTTEIISTIVLVVLIAAFLSFKSKREKDSSWKGESIKKKDISDEDNENHVYKLIFRTDSGKSAKVSVSEEMYNQSQIGDRFEKIAGEYTPKKIS